MSNVTAALADVQRLFDDGKYVQAFEASQVLGPLTSWHEPAGRILAGRLATRLGAPRLGILLKYLAYRSDRDNLMTRVYWGHVKLERQRVLPAWRFVRSFEPPVAASGPDLGHWQLLRAEVLSCLRDFQAADEWLGKAHDNLPDSAWYWCIRARVLAAQDQYESALQSAQQSFEIDASFLPAIQMTAQVLINLQRDNEALGLLTDASHRLESGGLFLQLGMLQSGLGDHQAARQAYEQAEAFFPLLEPELAQMLAARRSDAAYFCQDLEEAARYAELAANPFHAAILPKLAASPDYRRVVLPVPFVQQHHVTCVPATLTAISQYWSLPAEHLAIAEQICYDGTPAHSERQWAERNGFFAREFRATWDTAVALIDRKIPFILSTLVPGAGHAQAVVGYDTLRETLIIRDPSHRELVELSSEPLFQNQAASGPRAMVIVPVEEQRQLDRIDLVESEQYDCLYQLQLVLERHDRYRAQQVVERLQAMEPDHRLSLQAQSTLASYDGDPVRLLACVDRSLAMFPDNLNLLVSKLGVLSELGRRDERMALLQAAINTIGTHPVLLGLFAGELSVDARQSQIVLDLARQMQKYQPVDGQSLQLLAQHLWQNGERQQALELYRFIACFAERHEDAAKSYFFAARALGQTDAAFEFLQDRVQRFGAKSGAAATTLCWAHEQLGDLAGALNVLEEAVRSRPEDSDLLIFTAQYQALHGDFERARDLLQRARPSAHKGRWLRAAAQLAALEGAPEAAIARCRELLALEPQAPDAHSMLTQRLAESEGVQAGLLHLRRAVREHPRSYALRSLLLDWIKVEGPVSVENAAQEILEFQPADVRARCDLSVALLNQGRVAEALAEVETAAQLEPSNPMVQHLWGHLQLTLGRPDDAQEAFRKAIGLSADCSPAIGALLNNCGDVNRQREQLRFVYEQLKQQTIIGDGLFAFRDCAQQIMESEELLQVLREAHEARPDLWQTWSALIRHLIATGNLPDALTTAEQGVERFPLLPQMSVDLALVHRANHDRDQETEFLERAYRSDRACLEAARQLAVTYRETGQLEAARTVLMQTAIRYPADARVLRQLSECLWQLNEHAAALQKLTACLGQNPGDIQAWQNLAAWALIANEPEHAVHLALQLSADGGLVVADALTDSQPTSARWWRDKAQFLYQLDRHDEGLQCLRHALELDPQDDETHEDKALFLASIQRYDEALAACRPQAFADAVPPRLRFREAEIRWHRGDQERALVDMRRIVEEHPEYLPAWAVLTEWYSSQPTSSEYFAAAMRLTQLQPQLASNWCHLGCAALHREDGERAMFALRKALELDPSNLFAGWNAFDLCLTIRDAAGAREVLDKSMPFIRYEELLAARTRIAVVENDGDAATMNFRELCCLPRTDGDLALGTAGAMVQNRWRSQVRQILEEEIEGRRAGPAAGQVWTDVVADEQGWATCLRHLNRWTGEHSVWEIASCRFLELASSVNDEQRVQKFLKLQASQLRQSTQTWAAVGRSLAGLGRSSKAVEWLSDWSSRPDTLAWMLLPLTESLMELRRYVDAAVVSQQALQLPPDASSPIHALWLTHEEAISGEISVAYARFQQLAVEAFGESEFYTALYLLTRALIDGQMGRSASGEPLPFRAATRELLRARSQFPRTSKTRLPRRLYRRCLKRLAESRERAVLARWHALMTRF